MLDNEQKIQQARTNMVQQMLRPWNILNQRVLDVFDVVSRDQFVPKEYESVAFAETRIPLNDAHLMLTPVFEGRFLQEVRIEDHERILVVGTGSGFLAACASRLGKEVVAVDMVERFNVNAEAITRELGFTNIEYKNGRIQDVYKSLGTFDVIIFTGSMKEVPADYFDLLNEKGRLLAIVGKEHAMSATVFSKIAEEIRTTPIFERDLERLAGFEDKPEFVF
ncbi:protein-L-isoaspartate O-methyltransferase family protein [Ignatzschineria sp. LJL83]